MNRLGRQIAIAAGMLVILALSLALLSYAYAVHGIENGNRLLAARDYSAAESAYRDAENRISHSLVPSALYQSQYRVLVFNEARLFRAVANYTELAHLLERVVARAPDLANDPEYHFWTGIVEYAKAASQTDKQVVRASLQRAADSFRLAMSSSPLNSTGGDWDAKYNYELTARLLAGMRKNEETPEKLNRGGMKILREDPDHPKEQQQKLAPEKRS